ncbi:MAG: PIG-L family deacetylase [Clostridia bacterium]
MFKFILRKVSPIPKFDSFNTYLFVGPHPDDIEVGCAASVAKLVAQGKKVYFLIATDGRVGSNDANISQEQLVEIRQNEAKNSAKFLGVTDIIFLPFHDGGEYQEKDMRKSIAEQIVLIKPDIVLTTDYTVASECHPDHILVGQATSHAVCAYSNWTKLMQYTNVNQTFQPKMLGFYFTARPNCYFNVTSTFDKLDKSLHFFKSQFSNQDLEMFNKYHKLRAIRFGLRRCCAKCDGYRLLPFLQQHCFPEADEL